MKSLTELAREENDIDQLEVLAEVRRQDQQYDETIMHIKFIEALRKQEERLRIGEIKSTSIGK